MIVPVAVDDFVFPFIVFRYPKVKPGHFEGFFVSFGPAVGNVNFGQFRQQRGQFGRQVDIRRRRYRAGIVGKCAELVGCRLNQRFPPISYVDAPYAAGQHIQIFIAPGILDMTAVARHHDLRFLRFQSLMVGEVKPEMLFFQFDQFFDVGWIGHMIRTPFLFPGEAGKMPICQL